MRSDEELFERFRRGDAAALGELFDRVAPALLRIAVHLARDPGEAEDLLQATFLKAIEARFQFEAFWPMVLLPGRYELTITSETGKQEINRFTVGTQDPPDRRIPIRLP